MPGQTVIGQGAPPAKKDNPKPLDINLHLMYSQFHAILSNLLSDVSATASNNVRLRFLDRGSR